MNEDTEAIARRAMELGRAQALQVLAARAQAGIQAPYGTAGVVVAEGDSWFDYPGQDILGILEDHYRYEVVSVAHRGDRIEDIAYSRGQLDSFTRQIEKLVQQGKRPKAILLSGGGNDIAGDQFEMLLNHAASASPGLNRAIVEGVLQDRIFPAYITMIERITMVARRHFGTNIPVVVHGYGYAVPDGRGFLGGWSVLPGPWLEPGFRQKGYAAIGQRTTHVATLINAFNDMLQELTRIPELANLLYIDYRPLLSSDADYKDWWDNELHPTKRGFQAVTASLHRLLGGLP